VEALREHGGLWLGWSGHTGHDPAPAARIEDAGEFSLATVDLPAEDYHAYYAGFANHCLWPLLHFRADIAEFARSDYEAYLRINDCFAEALKPLLRADDVVWIHDYHLFPLPQALRRRGLRHRMGFFLHTPFPPADILQTLPRHRELMTSLTACDLIGLQTRADVERFCEYARRELGAQVADGVVRLDGRTVRVDAFPVGIDAEQFRALAYSPGGEREWRRMNKMLRGRTQIIGVDRLDYSKGLLRRLTAFERLLARHADTHGEVDFLQIAPVSRGEIKAYRDFRRELERKAAHINGRYAQVDWTPVRYLNRALPRRTLAGFYRASRIGLVTPMRDGMNLVAKEYVAAQDPQDLGVLVLSRFAGAAQQLDAALLVSPYDADEVAEALHRARSMDLRERRERHEALWHSVRTEDTSAWHRSYFAALTGAPVRPRAAVAR
jgi:trehalose 6-phosphate synthase